MRTYWYVFAVGGVVMPALSRLSTWQMRRLERKFSSDALKIHLSYLHLKGSRWVLLVAGLICSALFITDAAAWAF